MRAIKKGGLQLNHNSDSETVKNKCHLDSGELENSLISWEKVFQSNNKSKLADADNKLWHKLKSSGH